MPLTNTKKVLWFYRESRGKNLNRRLNREINNFILQNYLNNKEFSQNLPLKQNDVDTKLKKILQKGRLKIHQDAKTNRLLRFIKLSFLRRYTLERLNALPAPRLNVTLEKFAEIISISKSFTEKQNAKFYFVYLPHYQRYKNTKNNTNDSRNYGKVIKIVKNLDIPIIDINKELFLTLEDPLSLYPFRLQGHYNELGYRLVAETILKKIDEYETLEK